MKKTISVSVRYMKSNKQFMILSAIGIVMVVDAHSWTTINIFGSVFPYNSFFMALFLFVSGYFFNIEKNLAHPLNYLARKAKNLILPYLGWTAFYAVLVSVLKLFTPIKLGVKFSFYNYFILPFLSGEGFDINNPAYFVIVLFYTIVVYLVLRKILNKLWNEYVMQFIFVVLGSVVVAYSVSVNHAFAKDYIAMLLKVAFSLQFFQLGVFYKSKTEKIFNKMNTVGVVLFCVIAVNIIKLCFGDVNWTLNRLSFNPNYVINDNYVFCCMPFFVAVFAIAFWLKISKLLEKSLAENKLCNFISDHTFGIMMHHVAFMAFLNWVLVLINKITPLAGFDKDYALRSSWYRFHPAAGDFYFFYFLIGIVGACLVCYFTDKLFALIGNRYKEHKNKKSAAVNCST